MGIIAWIVFGLIAGAIAKAIMPGTQGGGFIMTTILGIVGALVGGFLGSAILGKSVSGFNIGSMLIAVVGALIVLGIWGWVQGRSSRV
ncbi:GlsB/YeaQ/YmgE family stress response membrane protein [Luteococcus sediminum]|uniref:GlsB/YeaQ/YmgE family stress response membrane protein n=1 Tax=Luteococcus sp. TaxID=1969402 RepID=UPI0037355B46